MQDDTLDQLRESIGLPGTAPATPGLTAPTGTGDLPVLPPGNAPAEPDRYAHERAGGYDYGGRETLRRVLRRPFR